MLLHGRGGPYSINVNRGCTLVSRTNPSAACNAGSLSKRHAMWGQYWADHGYVALLPDSFGSRGKAHGFGRFTHDDPDRTDVNEKTVRPLDAAGALSWLRSQKEINGDRIFLQGWSNGGSTALNVMQRQGAATSGYRAALVFYPGCGPAALLAQTIKSDAPITMLLGSDDEEVSPDPLPGRRQPLRCCRQQDRRCGLSGCHPRFRRSRPRPSVESRQQRSTPGRDGAGDCRNRRLEGLGRRKSTPNAP
ncbi:dienelactone hydrolase family protein [Bradyrhizobium elkanii]|nr:dienelactone hydrolase family protein [Bradyrhizobium elkanii]